jgi:hypothetical protein
LARIVLTRTPWRVSAQWRSFLGVNMEDVKKVETTEAAQKTRRAFVKTAAQVAVTAPAVAALLSASTKPASAQGLIVYSINDQALITSSNGNDTSGVFDPIRGGTVYDDGVTVGPIVDDAGSFGSF